MYVADPPGPIHNPSGNILHPTHDELTGTEPTPLLGLLSGAEGLSIATLTSGKQSDKMVTMGASRVLSCDTHRALDRRTMLALEELRGVNGVCEGEDSRDYQATNNYRPATASFGTPTNVFTVTTAAAIELRCPGGQISTRAHPAEGAICASLSKTDDSAWMVTSLGDCYSWVPLHDPLLSESSSSDDEDSIPQPTKASSPSQKRRLLKRSEKKIEALKKERTVGAASSHTQLGAWELAPSTVVDFRAYTVRNRAVPSHLAPHGSFRSVACGGKRCVWAVTEDSPGAEVWEGGEGGAGRILFRQGYIPGSSLAPTAIKSASQQPTYQRTGLEWYDYSDDVVPVPDEICLRGAWFSAKHRNKGDTEETSTSSNNHANKHDPNSWEAVMKTLLFNGERQVGESPTGLEDDPRDQDLSLRLAGKMLPRERQGIEVLRVAFARREWEQKFETQWAVHPHEYTGCFGSQLSVCDVASLLVIPSTKPQQGARQDEENKRAAEEAEALRQLLPPIITAETKAAILNDYNVSSIFGLLDDFERRANTLAARGITPSIIPPATMVTAAAPTFISTSVSMVGSDGAEDTFAVPVAPVSAAVAAKAAIASQVIREHIQAPLSAPGSRNALRGLSSTFSKICHLSQSLKPRQFAQMSIGQDGTLWVTTTEDVLRLISFDRHVHEIEKFNEIDHTEKKATDMEHNPLLPLYERRTWTRLWFRSGSSLTSEGTHWVEAPSGLGALVNALNWQGHRNEGLAPMSVRGTLSTAMEITPRVNAGFGIDNRSVSLQLPSYTIVQLAHVTSHQLFAVLQENGALAPPHAGSGQPSTHPSFLYRRMGITERTPFGTHWQRVKLCPYAWPTSIVGEVANVVATHSTDGGAQAGKTEPLVMCVSLFGERSSQGRITRATAILVDPHSANSDVEESFVADITVPLQRQLALGSLEVPLVSLPEHPDFLPRECDNNDTKDGERAAESDDNQPASFAPRGNYNGDLGVLLSQVLAETSRQQLYDCVLPSGADGRVPTSSASVAADGCITCTYALRKACSSVEEFAGRSKVVPSLYLPIAASAVLPNGGGAVAVNGGILYGSLRETLEVLRHDATTSLPDVLKCTLLEVTERREVVEDENTRVAANPNTRRLYEVVVEFDLNQPSCAEELPEEYFFGDLFSDGGEGGSQLNAANEKDGSDDDANEQEVLGAEADAELKALEVQGSFFTIGHTKARRSAAPSVAIGASESEAVTGNDAPPAPVGIEQASTAPLRPPFNPISRPTILCTLSLQLEVCEAIVSGGEVEMMVTARCGTLAIPKYHTVDEARHRDWQLSQWTPNAPRPNAFTDCLLFDHQLRFVEYLAGINFSSEAELARFGRNDLFGSGAAILSFVQAPRLVKMDDSGPQLPPPRTMRIIAEFTAPTTSSPTARTGSPSLLVQRTVHVQCDPEDLLVLGEKPRTVPAQTGVVPANQLDPNLTTIRIVHQQHCGSWLGRLPLCTAAVTIVMPLHESVAVGNLKHLVSPAVVIEGRVTSPSETLSTWLSEREDAVAAIRLGDPPVESAMSETSPSQVPPRGLFLILANGPNLLPVGAQTSNLKGSTRSPFSPSLYVVPHGGIFVGGWWPLSTQSDAPIECTLSTPEQTLIHGSFAAPTASGIPWKLLPLFLFTSLLPPTSDYQREHSFFTSSEAAPSFLGPISTRYQLNDRLQLFEKALSCGRTMPTFSGSLSYTKDDRLSLSFFSSQLRIAVRPASGLAASMYQTRQAASLLTGLRFCVQASPGDQERHLHHNNLWLEAYGEIHPLITDADVSRSCNWSLSQEMIFMGVSTKIIAAGSKGGNTRDLDVYKDGGFGCSDVDGDVPLRLLGVARRPNVIVRLAMSLVAPSVTQVTPGTATLPDSSTASSKAARKRVSAQKWVFGNHTGSSTVTPSTDAAPGFKFGIQPRVLLLVSASPSVPKCYPTGAFRNCDPNPFYNPPTNNHGNAPRQRNTWELMGVEGSQLDSDCGRLVVAYPLAAPHEGAPSSSTATDALPTGLPPTEVLAKREVLVPMGSLVGNVLGDGTMPCTVACLLKQDLNPTTTLPFDGTAERKLTLEQVAYLRELKQSQDEAHSLALGLLRSVTMLPSAASKLTPPASLPMSLHSSVYAALRAKGVLRLLGGAALCSPASLPVYERFPVLGLDGLFLRSSVLQCEAAQRDIAAKANALRAKVQGNQLRRFTMSPPSTMPLGEGDVEMTPSFLCYDKPVALAGVGPFKAPEGRRVILSLIPCLSAQGQADYDVLMEKARSVASPESVSPSPTTGDHVVPDEILINQIVHRALPFEDVENAATGVRCELLPLLVSSEDTHPLPTFSPSGSARGGGCVWTIERSSETQKRVTAREHQGRLVGPEVVYDGDLVNVRCYHVDPRHPSTYLAPPHTPSSVTTWRIRKVHQDVLEAQRQQESQADAATVDNRTSQEREDDDAVAAAARQDEFAQFTSDATQRTIAQRAILRRDLLKQATERKIGTAAAISVGGSQLLQSVDVTRRLAPLPSGSTRQEIDRLNRQYQPLLVSDVFTLEHPGRLHGCADEQKHFAQEVKREAARLISGSTTAVATMSVDVPFELGINASVATFQPFNAATAVLPLSPRSEASRDVKIEQLANKRKSCSSVGSSVSERYINFSQWQAIPALLEAPTSEQVGEIAAADDPRLLEITENCLKSASGTLLMQDGATAPSEVPLLVFGLKAVGTVSISRSVQRSDESTSGHISVAKVKVTGAFEKPLEVGLVGVIAQSRDANVSAVSTMNLLTGPLFSIEVDWSNGSKQPFARVDDGETDNEAAFAIRDPATETLEVPWATAHVSFAFDAPTTVFVQNASRTTNIQHQKGGISRVAHTRFERRGAEGPYTITVEVVGAVAEVPSHLLPPSSEACSGTIQGATTLLVSRTEIEFPVQPSTTNATNVACALPLLAQRPTADAVSVRLLGFAVLRQPRNRLTLALRLPHVHPPGSLHHLSSHSAEVLFRRLAAIIFTAQDSGPTADANPSSAKATNELVGSQMINVSSSSAKPTSSAVRQTIPDRIEASSKRLHQLEHRLRIAAMSRVSKEASSTNASFLLTASLLRDPLVEATEADAEGNAPSLVQGILIELELEMRNKAALLDLLKDESSVSDVSDPPSPPTAQGALSSVRCSEFAKYCCTTFSQSHGDNDERTSAACTQFAVSLNAGVPSINAGLHITCTTSGPAQVPPIVVDAINVLNFLYL